MNKEKQKALAAAGFDVMDAEDFLDLTEEERRLVDLKVALGKTVREMRVRNHLTQSEVAKRMKTSQSRVAKIEAASPGVSLDQMFRGLFAVGGTVADITCHAVRPTSAAETL
jgi:DNA-binding transcriptional regulator YiaG